LPRATVESLLPGGALGGSGRCVEKDIRSIAIPQKMFPWCRHACVEGPMLDKKFPHQLLTPVFVSILYNQSQYLT
jgi:hypothetical protein